MSPETEPTDLGIQIKRVGSEIAMEYNPRYLAERQLLDLGDYLFILLKKDTKTASALIVRCQDLRYNFRQFALGSVYQIDNKDFYISPLADISRGGKTIKINYGAKSSG